MADDPKAKGGRARAKALSTEERRESARRAALARWAGDLPHATHEAPIRVGDAEMMAAVLPNGMHLLSQGAFLRALGRSRTPKAGTGGFTTADDGLPFFLQAEQLSPFIPDELRKASVPILFVSKTGHRTVGYDAELLPMVCEVYLAFRDAWEGDVPAQYRHIVMACDVLMRGLARLGIIALIDEATGYQDVRARHALQAILDKYLRKELAAWAKTFPDEFYQGIYRLRDWEWKAEKGSRRPGIVAQYTKDIVYERLAPGILEELEARNPLNERGRRRARHHQWLTDDIGHPALAQHLYAVMGFMRVARSWPQFMTMLDVAYPKKNETLLLPFMADMDQART
jgi:P63C domain